MSVAEAGTRPEGYPDTPELDKMIKCREPVAGGLARFMEWMAAQGIRWCAFEEGRDRWVAVPDAIPAKFATEDPAGSEEIGAFLDELTEDADLTRCIHLESNADEVRAELVAEHGEAWLRSQYFAISGDPRYRSAGWYPDGRGISALLEEFYGVDGKAMDEERRAVLAWVRRGNGQGGGA
jgi:hypothetical protein